MADEKKKDEGKDEEGKEAQSAPPAKKIKLPLIIGGVVGLIVLIGAPIAFFTLRKAPEPTTVVPSPNEAVRQDENNVGTLEGAGEADQFDENEEPLGAIYPLETFVVNLSGGRFIRTQVQLEFIARDVPQRFYVRHVPIRDAILTLLTKKTQEDVLSDKGKEDLKKLIKDSVNEQLRKEEVKNVYFTQFVIQ